MSRRALSVVVAMLFVVVVVPSGASALRTCPPRPSGFVLYDIVGTPGDPAPDPGEDALWDRFVTDAITAFGSLEAALEAFGFETEADLYAFLLEGWRGWDKNADDHICIQDFPDTPGTPAYIWNGIDNSAKVPG